MVKVFVAEAYKTNKVPSQFIARVVKIWFLLGFIGAELIRCKELDIYRSGDGN